MHVFIYILFRDERRGILIALRLKLENNPHEKFHGGYWDRLI
jgi:hypothetical protein